VKQERQIPMTGEQHRLWGIDQLNVARSDIPAVTHIDYSARVQTVTHDTNPNYYDLIKEFERLTGCPVLVNTSFNVRGEPIVCTPADAYQCFMRTHIDYLVLGPFLLDKAHSPVEGAVLIGRSSFSSTDARPGAPLRPHARCSVRPRWVGCWVWRGRAAAPVALVLGLALLAAGARGTRPGSDRCSTPGWPSGQPSLASRHRFSSVSSISPVIMPIGLLLRARGRNPLTVHRSGATCWVRVPSTPAAGATWSVNSEGRTIR